MYRVVDNYPSQTPGNFTDWKIRDNICVGSFDDMMAIYSVGVHTEPTNDVDHNIYWNTHATSNLACINQPLGANNTRDTCRTGEGATLYTESQIATYRSVTGFDGNSQNVDPQLVDTPNNDFNIGNTSLFGDASDGTDPGAVSSPKLASCVTTDGDTITCTVNNPNGVLSSATLAAIDVSQNTNCTDSQPQSVSTTGNNLIIQLAGTACDPLVGSEAITIDMAYSALEDSLCIIDGAGNCINGESPTTTDFAVTNTIGGAGAAFTTAGWRRQPLGCTEPCTRQLLDDAPIAAGNSFRLVGGVTIGTADSNAVHGLQYDTGGGMTAISTTCTASNLCLTTDPEVSNGDACAEQLSGGGGSFLSCFHRTASGGQFPVRDCDVGDRCETTFAVKIGASVTGTVDIQYVVGTTAVSGTETITIGKGPAYVFGN
jgi:hypothetical protein